MKPYRRHWRVAASLKRVREVAREAEAACAEAGISRTLRANVRLCVAEAATNAVRHAYLAMPAGTVGVYLRIGTRAVVVEVSDCGRPMPAGLRVRAPEVDPARPHALPEGGMGLFLIESATDRWVYRTRGGRNTLRMLWRRDREATAQEVGRRG